MVKVEVNVDVPVVVAVDVVIQGGGTPDRRRNVIEMGSSPNSGRAVRDVHSANIWHTPVLMMTTAWQSSTSRHRLVQVFHHSLCAMVAMLNLKLVDRTLLALSHRLTAFSGWIVKCFIQVKVGLVVGLLEVG